MIKEYGNSCKYQYNAALTTITATRMFVHRHALNIFRDSIAEYGFPIKDFWNDELFLSTNLPAAEQLKFC
jgi:hypothetical protein